MTTRVLLQLKKLLVLCLLFQFSGTVAKDDDEQSKECPCTILSRPDIIKKAHTAR
jgi:hypothetical protein